MQKVIRDFPQQFKFEPKVTGDFKPSAYRAYLVCGMGGSQLATDILRSANPDLDLISWRDHDLPNLNDLKDRLIILSSYSGNTEETISSFHATRKKNLNAAVIAVGGELIELAKEYGVPYVQLPDTSIQPRMATGFALRALMALVSDLKGLKDTAGLVIVLEPDKLEWQGKGLAEKIAGKVPVIYASNVNEAIAKNWKIKFNENGKIPAFWNVFPELNHNEMTGFDVVPATEKLSQGFHFIFLADSEDHPGIQKRMQVTKQLFLKRGLPVEEVKIGGSSIYEKVFSALLLGDWTSYYTALHYGTEPEQVPMVEEFKKSIH
jgi:glucose/mannose-6-phosphate isomerase